MTLTRTGGCGDLPTMSAPHDQAARAGGRPGRRRRLLGFTGGTLWLTGLSGAGKSTLAGEIERRLLERGRPVMVLDGDVLRTGLNADLGFDRPAREENMRASGRWPCDGRRGPGGRERPHQSVRHRSQDARTSTRRRDPLVEVYLRAIDGARPGTRRGSTPGPGPGDLVGMTGVDDPYEAPEHPDIEITVGTGVGDAAGAVLDILDRW